MRDKYNKPVYLLASERSGTNILRKRITQNQEIYFGGSPIHFLKHLYYYEYSYGELCNNKNFLNLILDALELCYVHFSPWTQKYDAEEILIEYSKHFTERNVILLSHFLMTKYANDHLRKSYFCKDNYLYEFWAQIEIELPDALFIYLYRDPRDYVLSQIKRPESNKNIRRAARLWDYEQTKCLSAYISLSKRDKCIKISYENFISNETKIIKQVNLFLNVASQKNNLTTDKIVKEIQEWKNIEQETNKNNMNKYKNELSKQQVNLIESICWKTMKELGYKTENDLKPKVNFFHRLMFELVSIKTIIFRLLRGKLNNSSRDIIKVRTKMANKFHVNYRKP